MLNLKDVISTALSRKNMQPFKDVFNQSHGAHYAKVGKDDKKFLKAFCKLINSSEHTVKYNTTKVGLITFIPGFRIFI